MIIGPFVFATLVGGMASMGTSRSVERVGARDGVAHYRLFFFNSDKHDSGQLFQARGRTQSVCYF